MEVSRQRSARLAPWAALIALAVLYGCAGNGPAPQDPGSQFDQLQTNIFNRYCLSAGCHNAQTQAGRQNLSPGASYDSLVNVVPDNPTAQAAGLLRVVPNDPGNSFLITKLTGPGPGEGSRMPMGMDPLSQSDIDAIRSWILAGAPRGGTAAPTATPTSVPPTESATSSPSLTATPTITPIPVATSTASDTVTGTPPATPTPTASASPSPSPTATPTLGMFAEIQQTIFNTTCTDAFCHDVQGMSGGMVLVEGQSYANLVGVQPQNPAAQAAGLLRVDPGHPENSFLVVKVVGPPANGTEGNRMPLFKDPLTAQQIQLIEDWITAGAPQ